MFLKSTSGLFSKQFSIFLLVALSLLFALPLGADSRSSPLNVLILHSYNEHIPWNKAFTQGLDDYLDTRGAEFSVFREYLDVYRSGSKSMDSELVEYLRMRYSGLEIDIVVGESDEAATFVDQYQSEFAPDAATIYFASQSLEEDDKHLSIVPDIPFVVQSGIDYAFEQNPDAKQVLIVQGNNPEAILSAQAMNQSIAVLDGVHSKVISDFTLQSLLEEINTFPASGIIFYTLVFEDQTGKTYSPRAFLGHIAASSKAPVYVNYSTLVGNGAVGGYVIAGEALAKNVLEAASGYALNGRFRRHYKATSEVFDWKSLKQHGIPLSRTPSSAKIINRPQGFIEENLYAAIAALAGVALLLILVIFLAVYFAKRNAKLLHLNLRLEQAQQALSQSNEHLNQLAMHDSLTGIYNRRAAMPLMNEAMKKVQVSTARYALMLIDVDRFKAVNDQYGHKIGDEVLMILSKRVSALLRVDDVFARWGGEEFLLLARIDKEGDAQVVAEKIRRNVEASEFDDEDLKVTVSIGVVLTVIGCSFDQLFQRADKALYQAKQQGRNRVHLAAHND